MSQGYSVTSSPIADELLLVHNLMHPGRLREALLGYYHSQALTSALVSRMVAPQPGELVCDLCAEPGSKTSHMAQLMHNQGIIVANEPAHARLFMLEYNLKHLGISNVVTTRYAGQNFPLRYKFARLLVDAPCSGTGTLRRNPEARWRLQPAIVDRFPAQQLALLVTYAPLVAAGGRLIYATCSVLRSENDDVVARFCAERPDFAVFPLKEIWGKERAEPLGGGTVLRLSPEQHDTDGFFAAVLRRAR